MLWYMFETNALRAAEFVHSTEKAQLAWVRLLAYCAERENGGVIAGAAAWNDAQWMTICGVRRAVVLAAAPLLVIQGDNVKVWNYPKESERNYKRTCAANARNARRRWAKDKGLGAATGTPTKTGPAGKAEPPALVAPTGNPPGHAVASANAYPEEKKREVKRREEKERMEDRQEMEVPDGPSVSNLQTVLSYAEQQGMQQDYSRLFFNHFTANGWRVGTARNPCASWQAALRKWAGENGWPHPKKIEVELPPEHYTSGLEDVSKRPKPEGAP